MSEAKGAQAASTLVLRISVPAHGGYQALVDDLAARVAAYAGDPEPHGRTAIALLDEISRMVAPLDDDAPVEEMTVEFHQRGGELVMHASCDGRSADARRPLPTEPSR